MWKRALIRICLSAGNRSRLRALSVSIWITPSGSPSVPIIGAQIIERMAKSAMLCAMLNRSSLDASAERIALREFIASSTMVRRACSSSWRVALMHQWGPLVRSRAGAGGPVVEFSLRRVAGRRAQDFRGG